MAAHVERLHLPRWRTGDISSSQSLRHFKRHLLTYVWHGNLLTLIIAPIIYSLIVPLVILDLWATVYQWVCFPALQIPLVRRRPYLVMDRHSLVYLNGLEKINCTFCSYANGVLAYVREIGARTELYWCPIRHRRRLQHPHRHYRQFFDWDDARGFREELAELRGRLGRARRR